MDGIYQNNHMVYTGKIPWHNKGVYHDELKVADILEHKPINFEVQKVPLDANGVRIPDWYWLQRTDNGLFLSKGAVSKGYEIVQPKECFEFYEPLEEEGICQMETAGCLYGGVRIWALGKLASMSFEPIKGDEHNCFLLVCNSYDRRSSLLLMFTVIRVVCANTLHAAISRDLQRAVRIHHRAGAQAALKGIQEVIKAARTPFADLEEALRLLANKPIDYKSLRAFFFHVLDKPYRHPNEIEKDGILLRQLFESYEQQAETLPPFARGTWNHAMQAVTNWVDRGGASVTSESRMDFSWFGEGEKYRQKAFEYAIAA